MIQPYDLAVTSVENGCHEHIGAGGSTPRSRSAPSFDSFPSGHWASSGTGRRESLAGSLVLVSNEVTADWQRLWRADTPDSALVDREATTPRWRRQERLIRERFGTFDLSIIEVGSGRGTNALLFAHRGSRVTLLDSEPLALQQGQELAEARGVVIDTRQADVFDLPDDLRGRFDVSMSFGLCEHFLDQRRQDVVTAHLELLKPGGVALVSVPNRWAPAYRAWMGIKKRRGTWEWGTEVPFSVRELSRLGRNAGGTPLRPIFGSATHSLVTQLVNPVLLFKLSRSIPAPHVSIPVVDRFAYDLTMPICRS